MEANENSPEFMENHVYSNVEEWLNGEYVSPALFVALVEAFKDQGTIDNSSRFDDLYRVAVDATPAEDTL